MPALNGATTMSAMIPTTQPARAHRRWLRRLVEALDRSLRNRQGVREYSDSEGCIFRLQIIASREDVRLSDGTAVRLGDRVIDLHLWNERVPPIPASGATLVWARRIGHCVDISLRELARYLAGRTDLEDVRAIRGNMSLGSVARGDQIAHLAEHYGFERIPTSDSISLWQRMHRLGENMLISMLVLAHDAPLRTDTLLRDRILTYLSRRTLERRYGSVAREGGGLNGCARANDW